MWGPVTHKPWMVKYPTAAKNAAAGNVSVAGAARTLAGFEEGLYSPALAWRDWADEAAAVDWFLLTELTKVRGGGAVEEEGASAARPLPTLLSPSTGRQALLPLGLLLAHPRGRGGQKGGQAGHGADLG